MPLCLDGPGGIYLGIRAVKGPQPFILGNVLRKKIRNALFTRDPLTYGKDQFNYVRLFLCERNKSTNLVYKLRAKYKILVHEHKFILLLWFIATR
jgi:hypothetical protein